MDTPIQHLLPLGEDPPVEPPLPAVARGHVVEAMAALLLQVLGLEGLRAADGGVVPQEVGDDA